MTSLPKSYIAKDHESKIYALWQKKQAFKPTKTGEPFSILMPPPNANESLHVGHALMVSIEDVMIRYARMRGKRALWVPGTDHAGFETQVVYERKLQKEGKSRFDFAPQELREQIHAYVQEQQQTIISQIKMLGASCDWDNLYFTLDDHIVQTAYATFAKLHKDGLLYRAKRLVNYCVKHGTSFSDLEVEYEDREGQLTYIKYPYSHDKNKFVTVATTRPETMLGDTAIAVHPADKRYKNVDEVTVPLVNRVVKIVHDEAVDPAFGTGAVKVTPAHSHVDAAIAERHQLESIEVIDARGRIIPHPNIPESLHGLKVLEAREKIVATLHDQGLIEKIDKHADRVGVCYKCKTPIEVLPIEQWWVKTEPLAQKALKALAHNEITVAPKEAKKNVVSWLENIIDWNISRQIVWGIPIPAWYRKSEALISKHEVNSKKRNSKNSDFGFRISDFENENTEIKIQSESPGDDWVQDADTFDTWFSSTQLPYAALQYPKDPLYKTFFPTSVMETGADILYFWVARMIMMSLYVTGKVPFKHIYLHGLVLDAHGKKMSKSKGNVVDPLTIMDQYGTDALRWAVIHGTSAGQNFNMTLDRVVGGRNFANKIWNASRFVLMQLEQKHQARNSKHETNSKKPSLKHLNLNIVSPVRLSSGRPDCESIEAAGAEYNRRSDFGFGASNLSSNRPKNHLVKELLHETTKVTNEVTKCFESNQYALATDLIHEFFWHRFCDYYLEAAKPVLEDQSAAPDVQRALLTALTTSLKLIHPFMPFVTEAVWQELHTRKLVTEPLLITARWPA